MAARLCVGFEEGASRRVLRQTDPLHLLERWLRALGCHGREESQVAQLASAEKQVRANGRGHAADPDRRTDDHEMYVRGFTAVPIDGTPRVSDSSAPRTNPVLPT